MKPINRIVLPLAFLLISISACFSGTKTIRNVTPPEVQGLLRNDFAILVDVREKDEIQNGMADNALWFPTSKLEQDEKGFEEFLNSLPKDREIVFYCRSGARSSRAARKASELGYKVANMGGFKDWVSSGLPVKNPHP